jgi:lysozyme
MDLITRLVQLFILIKRFEGCRLMPYYCPAGKLTCGWGSTGKGIMPGVPWTQEYADQRMQTDAVRFARGVISCCKIPLSDAWLSALSDFAYNLGLGNLQASTLLRKVNGGSSTEEIIFEIRRWVHGGGKVLPGLVLRCEARASLMLSHPRT